MQISHPIKRRIPGKSSQKRGNLSIQTLHSAPLGTAAIVAAQRRQFQKAKQNEDDLAALRLPVMKTPNFANNSP